jgi:hypothetical protein
MQLKTRLGRAHPPKSFVYAEARMIDTPGGSTIEVSQEVVRNSHR